MKTFYLIDLKPLPAIADVCKYKDSLYLITRINVPIKGDHRGKGYGRQLLKEIIDDADNEQVSLLIEPLATGPLDNDELIAWYKRYGFVEYYDHFLIRYPHIKYS